MSIQSEIELLQNTKNELRTAITEKGVTVYADDLYSTYPTRISQISMTPGDKDNLFRDIIERDITLITIPDGTTTIKKYCFYHCENLESVFFPESLLTISENAFRYCVSLTSVTIPSSVTRIWDWAFDHCSGLTSITINATTPPTLTGDLKNAFDNTNNCPIYVPEDSVETYRTAWSDYASRIQAIVVESFAMKFTPAGGGTPIEVELEDLATEGTIASTDVPSTIKNGTGTLEIGEGVTTIDFGAFQSCTSLASIEIPSSVTLIESSAFKSCTSLNYVLVNATTPPTLGTRNNSFYDTNECPLIIPSGSLETYLADSSWAVYKDRLVERGVAYWTEQSYQCEVDESDKNTGMVTVVEKDINPTSSTYNTTRQRTYEDLERCKPVSPVSGFTKITSLDEATSGKYLIVDTANNVALNASLIANTMSTSDGINDIDNYISVEITGDTIEATERALNAAVDYDGSSYLTWTDENTGTVYYLSPNRSTSSTFKPNATSPSGAITLYENYNGDITFKASAKAIALLTNTSGSKFRWQATASQSNFNNVALFKLM